LGTVRVIARPALIHFWERHPDAKDPLNAWYRLMLHRSYENPNQLKAEFSSASLLENSHVCFNIGGNKYRLLVHVRYDIGIMFVKRVMTHADYDALNKAGTLIERKAR
jgi:mRNA interferase HigB